MNVRHLACALGIACAVPIAYAQPTFSIDPASPSVDGFFVTPDDLLRRGPSIYRNGTTLGLQDDFFDGVYDVLDALSFGQDPIRDPLYFSVDRVAVGLPGSAVFDLAAPGVADAARHVYVSQPPNGSNALYLNGGSLGLQGGFFGDDLDALELDTDAPHIYFSIDALSASNGFGASGLASNIYIDRFPTLYASFADIGLDPMDDLDALVLSDRFANGVLDRGVDRALFSLSPFSPSVFTYTGLDYEPCVPGRMSPADVCITDFRGGYGFWASAAELGLRADDNLNALDTVPEPESLPLVAAGALAWWMASRRSRRGAGRKTGA